jgi:uncharacterized protein (TIGR03032 family)
VTNINDDRPDDSPDDSDVIVDPAAASDRPPRRQRRAMAAAGARKRPAGGEEKVEPGEGRAAAKEEPLDISASRQFVSWMGEHHLSLAFTTYQAAKLFLIGVQPNGKLSLHRRTLPRCMGMKLNGNSLWVSSLFQLWRFENILPPGKTRQGHDRIYVPKVGFVTGDVDIHDIAFDRSGRVIFVNSLYCCLATVSPTHSFVPLWRPPFVSKLAAEDRCHLNGLAMKDGRPGYVTTISQGDVADGWRDHRRDGGTVIDVQANEIVAEGLSMPHSPRWYRGRLWLHNSGSGEFGSINLATGKFEPLCFCPGYLRGMDFVGDFAVVGLSKPRKNREFNGLVLQETLEAKKATARCAIYVIDLRTGDMPHWMRMDGAVQELYDVAVIPNCRRPMAIGFQGDEIRRAISVGRPGPVNPVPRRQAPAPEREQEAAEQEPAGAE